MAEDKQAAPEAAAPAKSGDSKGALLIAVLVLNCVLMGVVAFFQFQIVLWYTLEEEKIQLIL